MDLARRLGATLIAWFTVFAVSVVLSGGTGMYVGATDVQLVQDASEANASVRHEHGETDWSEDCHPGMACSLSAVGVQQMDITQTQRASDVKPFTVARVADRFTPVSDPPPPRHSA